MVMIPLIASMDGFKTAGGLGGELPPMCKHHDPHDFSYFKHGVN